MRSLVNISGIMKLVLMGFAATVVLSSAIAADNDWVTLIDGTEGMENFNIVGDANWSAEHNAIQATKGSGASWLVSKESYSDFSLRVEFWASDDSNSGIYMLYAL